MRPWKGGYKVRILVIDDEEGIRHMLSILLKKEGYDVTAIAGADGALKTIDKEDFDFILCDIKMPGMDGLEFLKRFFSRPEKSDSTVIMMSAFGTTDLALNCMKLGAYDYISKPFKPDEIVLVIKKAEERERLKAENRRLREESFAGYGDVYAKDEKMVELLAFVKKVAGYDATVLISGETGTGKEMIARAIHSGGNRGKGPFVAVNCGAIPENLIESELFGHVKGAFTDAIKTKAGLFHQAHGGTIFLDEIGELPKELQVKLLRVLQEGDVRMVGDVKDQKVDVRVVAATIRNLEDDIRTGAFRDDLFYRLNVLHIKVPPLRDRRADIEGLAAVFASKYARRYAKSAVSVGAEAMAALMEYSWPGNVRELENVIERAVIIEDGGEITAASLPFRDAGQREQSLPLDTLSIKKAEEIIERDLIKKALDITGGNKTRAAELLEISHRTLLYKLKNYGM